MTSFLVNPPIQTEKSNKGELITESLKWPALLQGKSSSSQSSQYVLQMIKFAGQCLAPFLRMLEEILFKHVPFGLAVSDTQTAALKL